MTRHGNPPVTAEGVLAAALELAKLGPPPDPVVIVAPTVTALVDALAEHGEPGLDVEALGLATVVPKGAKAGPRPPDLLRGIPVHFVHWATGPRLLPEPLFRQIDGLIRKAFPGGPDR